MVVVATATLLALAATPGGKSATLHRTTMPFQDRFDTLGRCAVSLGNILCDFFYCFELSLRVLLGYFGTTRIPESHTPTST